MGKFVQTPKTQIVYELVKAEEEAPPTPAPTAPAAAVATTAAAVAEGTPAPLKHDKTQEIPAGSVPADATTAAPAPSSSTPTGPHAAQPAEALSTPKNAKASAAAGAAGAAEIDAGPAPLTAHTPPVPQTPSTKAAMTVDAEQSVKGACWVCCMCVCVYVYVCLIVCLFAVWCVVLFLLFLLLFDVVAFKEGNEEITFLPRLFFFLSLPYFNDSIHYPRHRQRSIS